MTAQARAYQAIRGELFDREARPDRFNPYAQTDLETDRPDAVTIRRDNLRRYLDACHDQPPLFLLAEAPGPWGCRFSGVPITSEAQLLDPAFPLGGRQSSAKPEPHTEYSANIFWSLLAEHFPKFVVWNACPMHPFKPGKPFSIRAPRRAELREFQSLAVELIRIFRPAEVLAVGRKAEWTLTDAGVECTYVRHPSQGGANAFREGVEAALGRHG